MAKTDFDVSAHLEWIGFVRPTGLVVSAPALVQNGAILNRRDATGQELLRGCVEERRFDPEKETRPFLPDFRAFASKVLDWNFSPAGYAGTDEEPIPSGLEAPLPDSGEVLRPAFAVRAEPRRNFAPDRTSRPMEEQWAPSGDAEPEEWQLLVDTCETGEDFDDGTRGGSPSPHGRMERLLRHTGVPAGLLFNGVSLRLISAPPGESSGWLDFRVSDMRETAGRPIVAAMRLLLGQTRLLGAPRNKRLAALLEYSRKFQNEVSERLADQVLHALYELVRGFQAAHDLSKKTLLARPLWENPDEVYRGLLTLVLRLVFLLYTEERDMLPQNETFLGSYSLAGLHERLREDAARHPDTMDQRYGAWAQLLVLFRMIHDGARSGDMALSPRRGYLFDPDRYPFLEGRDEAGRPGERIEPPLVPDGTIYRVLEKLFVLDGERISYRALDVEHIGSVYEKMMGFRMEIAAGRSIAVRAAKKHGASAAIDLEALLREKPADRAKWMRDRTDRNLSANAKKDVEAADTVDALHAALDSMIDRNATPDLVPKGSMALQPNEERRRSGSHYTPRELTEPIVRKALAPILKRLRGGETGSPDPERLLDLKVCDPAVGSGAFLVETCRQLGDALVESWRARDAVPEIPPDEDETIYARRLIARRCLYGIDRNPVALDLAKLSLWLVTLARDHPLTFLDHALRRGDLLVGLSRPQIQAFHWSGDKRSFQADLEVIRVSRHMERVAELRKAVREAGEDVSDREVRRLWEEARSELNEVRAFGDLAVWAFFDAGKPKEREKRLRSLFGAVESGETGRFRQKLDALRNDPTQPLAPFHWEIEFPETFERENPGFDVIVGNPPFAGKNTVLNSNRAGYLDWLKQAHAESHGNADLVAHFYRRAFDLLCQGGAFGLIATNTISQGDTRSTGLRWICRHGGEIYRARRRVKWPGLAAVVVSVVHVVKGEWQGPCDLDGCETDTITAFLFHAGGHDDPAQLDANAEQSFQGSIVLGMGFTFDDTDRRGVATPIAEKQRLIAADPHNQEAIFPYIGGEEVNTSPTHAHHRHVINFRDYPLCREDLGSWERAGEQRRGEWLREGIVPLDYPEPVAADWPDLLGIVHAKVKPERAKLTKNPIGRKRAKFWWQYGSLAKKLYARVSGLYANDRLQLRAAIDGMDRVLTVSRVGQHAALAFLPATFTFSDSLIVFPFETHAAFCALQSRPHEIWARFFGSSMKDDLRYTPSDCFETFPFPEGWETRSDLEAAGKEYYEFRAALMIENDEGMTKTYNRFHDPEECSLEITELRRLHAAMDRAVLDAYGWPDVSTGCKFLLDYEIDEEEWGNKKKPWRYRWPNPVRDDVLARLLALNAQRAMEEHA